MKKLIELGQVLEFLQREIKRSEKSEYDCNFTDDRESMEYYSARTEALKDIELKIKAFFL